uniref:Uncharacterized protein n=1 Tax=Chromera velia CCMP2878 TaxID=1169474 RepID=A0A0G4FVB0_9ALVE|eukprot:Cvel_3790.t1-p1 / transcript=Cvel_3790.t1 / gene=Cvel_3790 / organism=Chromera_velia_CCMP2878 / gene_product=hypothetical protein / transcript_product=hypothetical protein / location=Cvel_scaffold159:52854-62956(+) / protein_length=1931 / sequence_SO=supercontig / SO=protein_coding / is_pseudo=false
MDRKRTKTMSIPCPEGRRPMEEIPCGNLMEKLNRFADTLRRELEDAQLPLCVHAVWQRLLELSVDVWGICSRCREMDPDYHSVAGGSVISEEKFLCTARDFLNILEQTHFFPDILGMRPLAREAVMEIFQLARAFWGDTAEVRLLNPKVAFWDRVEFLTHRESSSEGATALGLKLHQCEPEKRLWGLVEPTEFGLLIGGIGHPFFLSVGDELAAEENRLKEANENPNDENDDVKSNQEEMLIRAKRFWLALIEHVLVNHTKMPKYFRLEMEEDQLFPDDDVYRRLETAYYKLVVYAKNLLRARLDSGAQKETGQIIPPIGGERLGWPNLRRTMDTLHSLLDVEDSTTEILSAVRNLLNSLRVKDCMTMGAGTAIPKAELSGPLGATCERAFKDGKKKGGKHGHPASEVPSVDPYVHLTFGFSFDDLPLKRVLSGVIEGEEEDDDFGERGFEPVSVPAVLLSRVCPKRFRLDSVKRDSTRTCQEYLEELREAGEQLRDLSWMCPEDERLIPAEWLRPEEGYGCDDMYECEENGYRKFGENTEGGRAGREMREQLGGTARLLMSGSRRTPRARARDGSRMVDVGEEEERSDAHDLSEDEDMTEERESGHKGQQPRAVGVTFFHPLETTDTKRKQNSPLTPQSLCSTREGERTPLDGPSLFQAVLGLIKKDTAAQVGRERAQLTHANTNPSRLTSQVKGGRKSSAEETHLFPRGDTHRQRPHMLLSMHPQQPQSNPPSGGQRESQAAANGKKGPALFPFGQLAGAMVPSGEADKSPTCSSVSSLTQPSVAVRIRVNPSPLAGGPKSSLSAPKNPTTKTAEEEADPPKPNKDAALHLFGALGSLGGLTVSNPPQAPDPPSTDIFSRLFPPAQVNSKFPIDSFPPQAVKLPAAEKMSHLNGALPDKEPPANTGPSGAVKRQRRGSGRQPGETRETEPQQAVPNRMATRRMSTRQTAAHLKASQQQAASEVECNSNSSREDLKGKERKEGAVARGEDAIPSHSAPADQPQQQQQKRARVCPPSQEDMKAKQIPKGVGVGVGHSMFSNLTAAFPTGKDPSPPPPPSDPRRGLPSLLCGAFSKSSGKKEISEHLETQQSSTRNPFPSPRADRGRDTEDVNPDPVSFLKSLQGSQRDGKRGPPSASPPRADRGRDKEKDVNADPVWFLKSLQGSQKDGKRGPPSASPPRADRGRDKEKDANPDPLAFLKSLQGSQRDGKRGPPSASPPRADRGRDKEKDVNADPVWFLKSLQGSQKDGKRGPPSASPPRADRDTDKEKDANPDPLAFLKSLQGSQRDGSRGKSSSVSLSTERFSIDSHKPKSKGILDTRARAMPSPAETHRSKQEPLSRSSFRQALGFLSTSLGDNGEGGCLRGGASHPPSVRGSIGSSSVGRDVETEGSVRSGGRSSVGQRSGGLVGGLASIVGGQQKEKGREGDRLSLSSALTGLRGASERRVREPLPAPGRRLTGSEESWKEWEGEEDSVLDDGERGQIPHREGWVGILKGTVSTSVQGETGLPGKEKRGRDVTGVPVFMPAEKRGREMMSQSLGGGRETKGRGRDQTACAPVAPHLPQQQRDRLVAVKQEIGQTSKAGVRKEAVGVHQQHEHTRNGEMDSVPGQRGGGGFASFTPLLREGYEAARLPTSVSGGSVSGSNASRQGGMPTSVSGGSVSGSNASRQGGMPTSVSGGSVSGSNASRQGGMPTSVSGGSVSGSNASRQGGMPTSVSGGSVSGSDAAKRGGVSSGFDVLNQLRMQMSVPQNGGQRMTQAQPQKGSGLPPHEIMAALVGGGRQVPQLLGTGQQSHEQRGVGGALSQLMEGRAPPQQPYGRMGWNEGHRDGGFRSPHDPHVETLMDAVSMSSPSVVSAGGTPSFSPLTGPNGILAGLGGQRGAVGKGKIPAGDGESAGDSAEFSSALSAIESESESEGNDFEDKNDEDWVPWKN